MPTEQEFIQGLQAQLAERAQTAIENDNALGTWILANLPDGGGDTTPPIVDNTIYFHSANGPFLIPWKTKLWHLVINKNDRYTLGPEYGKKYHPTEKLNVAYRYKKPSKAPWGKPPVVGRKQTKWEDWLYVLVKREGEKDKFGMILLYHHGYWNDAGGVVIKSDG